MTYADRSPLPHPALPAFHSLPQRHARRHGAGRADPRPDRESKFGGRDIFLRRSDGRASRIGFVPANETATFALPSALTAGAPWIRFEARPARGSGEPLVSEQFPVKQGDEISWSVPPQ